MDRAVGWIAENAEKLETFFRKKVALIHRSPYNGVNGSGLLSCIDEILLIFDLSRSDSPRCNTLGGDWEVSTLTDDKRNQSVLTPTVTETELGGQDFGALTPEEERVLRMRHGLTEGPEHMLSFAVGANEETMLKLAASAERSAKSHSREVAWDILECGLFELAGTSMPLSRLHI